ncbi:HK97 family phage prohead protease [Gluconobacter frateurii]|uniref:Bacteriophage protease n=1 Tax=Gluconobacter frateurii NRIC 0228 TaxID=1307946 RepID=A0ABQ0QCS4_9PROT|nr:HK97 family phage prohead protease [Gluconobacter frateurii]GBR14121.1 bacteriophage protease [Gluconobacter frateurii NRIC 0228]GLP92010.1 peptidase U35 [Gluconobacter frateurii]
MKKTKHLNIKEFVSLDKDQREDVLVTKDVSIKLEDVDSESRTASFIITTGTPDTSADVVVPDGVDFTFFDKNPVVLWQHNRDELPVGKCISHKKISNGHIATVEFAPSEMNPKAEQIFQLVKSGFLSAVSVGFIPTDLEPNSYGGYTINNCFLFEFSIVTVPANPECLIVEQTKPKSKSMSNKMAKAKMLIKLYK